MDLPLRLTFVFCVTSLLVGLSDLPAVESFAMPPLSTWYFTCRHTFEDILTKELSNLGVKRSRCQEVAPGLLRVQSPALDFDPLEPLTDKWDLTYALQVLPECKTVRKSSIKELALGAIDGLGLAADSELAALLRSSPRGSLAVHGLVQDHFKGARNARGERRALTVADKMRELLRKSFPAARSTKREEDSSADDLQSRWLLQLLLLNAEEMEVSLTKCRAASCGGSWPCWSTPAGLAQVDIDKEREPMPSSAYRKLEESFACMEVQPGEGELCVDLGACPGGWTKALRRKGSRVVAVDRSELVPELMADPGVAFIQGDAFTFSPSAAHADLPFEPWQVPIDWMVSDVIAAPDRVTELLDRWCGEGWARKMVVTMKFKGDPDFAELSRARSVAEGHGYAFRSKHFFNNKNEVSLMLVQT